MKILKCKYCGKEYESDGSKKTIGIFASHCRECLENPNRDKNINARKLGSAIMNKKVNEKRSLERKNDLKTKKPREFKCKKCGKPFFIDMTDNEYKSYLLNKNCKKYRKFCSSRCSHIREWNDTSKEKLRKSLHIKSNKRTIHLDSSQQDKKVSKKIKKCSFCKREFNGIWIHKKFCSEECYLKYKSQPRVISDETRRKLSEAGKKSASIMSSLRRSKNEMLFCDMCKNTFSNVTHNEPLFNGWDADVLLHDFKIAVLWNGKWHYVQIMGGQNTLKCIQNRDIIKEKEIRKMGWYPYIIKDMGKYNPDFVKEKFEEFVEFLKLRD